MLASLGVRQTLPFRLIEAAVISDCVATVLESLGSDCWEVGAHNCPAVKDNKLHRLKTKYLFPSLSKLVFLRMLKLYNIFITLLTCISYKNAAG